jgi:hypothetical protein
MIQRGERLGFALEAREAIVVSGKGVGEGLDRDLTAKRRVLRAIDLPHAAFANRRGDFVDAETRPGHE